MIRLAIVTTHPIQYYAPLFKLLHQRGKVAIKVFYTWGEASVSKHDPGFGKQISWDVPLLDGYEYEWAANTAKDPGTHHFKGIITPNLTRQIKTYQPNAILVFGWAYHGHLKALRYFKGRLPVYFRGDSTLLDERKGFKWLLRQTFLKWVYGYVDHAFYVGSANKAYFLKHGLQQDQLTFAPHAIDNGRFAIPRDEEAFQLRKELGIAVDDILVLFAGKLEDKKSPDLLLQAFIRINDPRLHLLFVGNGKLEADLKAKAAANKNIHFRDLANQSYMPVIYQACDVFCLPSKGLGETWGLAVNEAMACSKAVIVSDKCGCAADIVGPDNGSVFQSGDIEELIVGLKKITASKAHAKNLGDASAEIIANWSLTNAATAIEDRLMKDIKPEQL